MRNYENSFTLTGIEKLRSCSGSYSLTATKRSHCNACRSCSGQTCKSCPVTAEYDRLFDIFCDREEARQERFNSSLSALLSKYGQRRKVAATA